MIKIDNLKKTYDKGSRHQNEVLHGLSISLPDTGFVCILGPSGCGKTSLLNAIGGLDLYDSGRITTDTATITRSGSRDMEKERNAAFGYIFQNYYLLSEHSVAYNVYLGLHSLPISRKDKLARVKDALARVDMLRYRKRPVGELSGGQQQRVAIARAIARRPRVIFADEPTGNLDQANTMNICTILKQLSRDSLVVMVTHEEGIARFFADRIITLDAGCIVSDTTEWERTAMDAGAKDTLYAGDYDEQAMQGDRISLRVLQAADAPAVKLTVVAEKNRIIIKVDDPRVCLCSEPGTAPLLAEGAHPVLTDADDLPTVQSHVPDVSEPTVKRGKGLGLGMLFKEARGLVSGKKLRKFGTGVFIVLLSLMLSISVADLITVAHVNPEDFITTDSKALHFSFERGAGLTDKYAILGDYIAEFRTFLEGCGQEFDYIPECSDVIIYRDETIPQFDMLAMRMTSLSWVNIKHLDPDTIISGRMPERSDEVVLDRWMVDKLLAKDGVLQNLIPGVDYLLGKQLTCDRKSYALTVVGICDSGEPCMYMSTEAMLAFGICGTEVITRSEYMRLTGQTLPEIEPNRCIVLGDNTSSKWNADYAGQYVGSYFPMISDAMLTDTDDSITAKLIIADEDLEPLFASMIQAHSSFGIRCADKAAMLEVLKNDMPEDLANVLDVLITDKYAKDWDAYTEQATLKLDARTIVTFTVLLAAALMLYLMQRSKIRERMDLIAVYRLLGIPKHNLLTVFALESLILTLKYALPTVAGVYVAFLVMARVEMLAANALLYPLWAAALTLLAIALYRLLVATLPVLRLLRLPPARLAAKYDF